jgi:hypothetical protein
MEPGWPGSARFPSGEENLDLVGVAKLNGAEHETRCLKLRTHASRFYAQPCPMIHRRNPPRK